MQVRDMGNTGMEESWYKKQVRLTKAPNFPEGDCNGKHLGKHWELTEVKYSKVCFLDSKFKSFLSLEILRQKLNKTHNLSFKAS